MTGHDHNQEIFYLAPAATSAIDAAHALRFTKMEGTGNDYVYIEEFGRRIEHPSELAIKISNRHFGVGSDGLVLIGPSAIADFRMRMFNSDGSEGEMCGNASRCVGKYVYEHGLTARQVISLETLAGVKLLHLSVDSNNRVLHVRVDMGEPVLLPANIPMLAEGERFIGKPVEVTDIIWLCTAVSMGNPHIVVPVPDVMELDIAAIGPHFEHHAMFPRSVNTEFIQVPGRDRIRMRVWERGAGETLACGTGACAALVACVLNGWTERKATVELRGGELEVEWAEDGRVYMTGPAVEIFSGEFRIR